MHLCCKVSLPMNGGMPVHESSRWSAFTHPAGTHLLLVTTIFVDNISGHNDEIELFKAEQDTLDSRAGFTGRHCSAHDATQ